MHAKYEVSTADCTKVMANNKVADKQTDGQTDGQTNRRGKNNMPPITDLGA